MATSDDLMAKLCDALRAEIGSTMDFDLDLGELVGRYRKRHERHMRDVEAARLLPLGAEVVAERQHCHRVTVYRRARRARIVAFRPPLATDA